jgi:hypothetical protein
MEIGLWVWTGMSVSSKCTKEGGTMLHTTSALLLVTSSIIKHVELKQSDIICPLWSCQYLGSCGSLSALPEGDRDDIEYSGLI